ncbi:MAG: hypothetical protein NVS4B8_11690 [Herpetosiphon sp.]
MLEHAISYYHELLDPATARATGEQLNAEQRARNLYFGPRPLVSVLRPRFLSPDQYTLLQDACGAVATAMRTLVTEVLEEPVMRSDLMLTPGEEALIAMDPGYPDPSAHSRMDTFLTLDGSSLRFVEYNAESPAAIAYEDLLSDLFMELPVMQHFARRYDVQKLPARHKLLETLLAAWSAWGSSRAPTIAILDWTGLPTHTEFVMFQSYFHEHGLDAVICSPDDLRFDGHRLFATVAGRTMPVDLVYKRVLTTEFLVHYGAEALTHPLVQAYAAGKVCLVNSFRAKLLHKKSIFALLTRAVNQPLYTPAQQVAIERHVPWTRVVRPGPTTYHGDAIDLLPWAVANRDRLLLKPNDDYGGKGIVIGWESDPSTWQAALADAQKLPFVIQERVEIAYEDYPSLVDGQLDIRRRLVDSDPFLFGTAVTGSLTRLSTVTLLNVTAGGGSTVPAFVIQPRAGEVA